MNLSKACVRVAHLGMAQTLGIVAQKKKEVWEHRRKWWMMIDDYSLTLGARFQTNKYVRLNNGVQIVPMDRQKWWRSMRLKMFNSSASENEGQLFFEPSEQFWTYLMKRWSLWLLLFGDFWAGFSPPATKDFSHHCNSVKSPCSAKVIWGVVSLGNGKFYEPSFEPTFSLDLSLSFAPCDPSVLAPRLLLPDQDEPPIDTVQAFPSLFGCLICFLCRGSRLNILARPCVYQYRTPLLRSPAV